jgi:hypothetical protein
MAIANCTVTILRGDRIENEYLDEEDVSYAVVTGVPASVRESRPIPLSDDTGATAVKSATIRLPHGTDVKVRDRVTVEKTGETYQVRIIQTRNLPFGGLRLEVIKVSGRV